MLEYNYCDTTSGGGGWTVIQRRKDGSVDFYHRDWAEFEDGFGSLEGEFWLGLRSVHCLTSQGNWKLRIDYQLSNGTRSYLSYRQCRVGPAEDQYQLQISGFSSIGQDDPFSSAGTLNGKRFTSHDYDNDLSSQNCAIRWDGGWYSACGGVKVNNHSRTIYFQSQWNASPFMEMKIRPLNCDMN